MTYIVRITPSVAQELYNYFDLASQDDPDYKWFIKSNCAPGSYELEEEAVNELQSWSGYHTGTLREWIADGDREYFGLAKAISALHAQTVKLIGLRHTIG